MYFIEVALDVGGMHAGPPLMMPLFYDLFVTWESSFGVIPESSSFALLVLTISAILVPRRAHEHKSPR